MPVRWDVFESALTDYFINLNKSRTMAQASQQIARLYNDAVKDASLKNGNRLVSFDNESMANGLLNVFELNMRLKRDSGLQPYILLSQAIVDAWKSSKFNPEPPFPPTVEPELGVIVENAGDADELGQLVYNALHTFDAKQAVDGLIAAFKVQLEKISGKYHGYIFEIQTNEETGEEEEIKVKFPPIPWSGIV